MNKNAVKQQLKHILYALGSEIEDDNKSYWYIFQIIIELLIEFLYAGFKDKDIRIKIINEVMQGIIKQIKTEKDEL